MRLGSALVRVANRDHADVAWLIVWKGSTLSIMLGSSRLLWPLLAAACSFPDVTIVIGGEGGGTSASSMGGAPHVGGTTASSSGGEGGAGGEPVPGVPVDLGTADGYVVLSKSGITNVPPSVITGDVGVSPIASTAITGFVLIPDASMTFSTSQQVDGRVYAASHAEPSPTNLAKAVLDMEAAFAAAAARAPDVTALGAGEIGDMVIVPGVYSWTTPLTISTSVTLDGNATDVWIFQTSQTLDVGADVQISLTGGALPENVFWQASGAVIVAAGAHLEGVVLTQTSIAMHGGASLRGSLFAQTNVTLSTNEIIGLGP